MLEVTEEDQSFLGWYNIDISSATWDPEAPLAQRRLSPEWAEKKTQKRGKPRTGQEHLWEQIYGEFNASQAEIIVPKFHLQTGGKVPENVCRKVDAWLRQASRTSPRAVLQLTSRAQAV